MKLGQRRQARECALQMLFQLDITGDSIGDVLGIYFEGKTIANEVRAFSTSLVRRAVDERGRVDELLRETGSNWRLERMAVVDRNILRLATAELLTDPETPRNVILNEAIEIAKRFSSAESAQFINGVLDAVKRRLEGEEVTPAAEPDA